MNLTLVEDAGGVKVFWLEHLVLCLNCLHLLQITGLDPLENFFLQCEQASSLVEILFLLS